MTLCMGCPGGLKGQIASGDAHPYLALFDWEKYLLRHLNMRRVVECTESEAINAYAHFVGKTRE